MKRASDLGFIGIGFSPPSRPPHFNQFISWMSARKYADMAWLERNIEIRKDPSRLLPGCNTIISLAYPYPALKTYTADGLSVARYSQPDQNDYHSRLRTLCKNLADTIRDIEREARVRICVDSAPILERSMACSSGIGFIGKNNMLIIPGFGSYFYLAEILTTATLEIPEKRKIKSGCGSCELCVRACPTGALEKPFFIDASICLSYLTVERREPLGETDGNRMGDCFFGCDRCQEVCPFNGEGMEKGFILPSSEEFLEMEEKHFLERFGKTSFGRAGLEKIKSNIRAIKGRTKQGTSS